MDYKGMANGEIMPEWVSLYLEGGVRAVETLEIYQDYHVFVSRLEGNNFNAMNHWIEGFSPELDFPRLASARIESRFLLTAPLPDSAYGAFFVALIRAASDALWDGALKEDDFWILKKPGPEESEEKEIYEFLILVTIRKTVFVSQFDAVFRSVRPSPPPTRDQLAAINRVKERFYAEF
jgi:hypothetical protein